MRLMRRNMVSVFLVIALTLVSILPGSAQSTNKSLSTNFTVVNLGSGQARGQVQYIQPNGSLWGSGYETFTITQSGGQLIFRQYNPPGQPGNPNLTSGFGSAIVSADQPLGAVVQILARGQNPTSSGAYSGFTEGASSFYVPLAVKNLSTASGLGNSQIIAQNVSTISITVRFRFINPDGTEAYSKTFSLQPGASVNEDLALESGLPSPWFGSAVVEAVTSGGLIAVVSNFFTGDALQTFNGFSSASPRRNWFVPLFASRLSNGLSTPVAVQNLSGATIPAGQIQLVCKPDPALSGYSTLTLTNTSPLQNTAAYYFNPVTDTSIPAGFYGSCQIQASANVVAFVQMRFISTGEAAAYEAIPAGGTDRTVVVPLVAKRLGNGFATAVTIQNLSAVTATVTLTYFPSPEYPGSSTPITIPNLQIGPYASLIQNHRITSGPGSVPALPEGWFGSLKVTSNQPIGGFVQLTFLRSINPSLPGGDNFMAHNVFTQP